MKNIFQTIRQWQRGNAAAKMLHRFDDHLLADLGIARGDISRAVHIFHRRQYWSNGLLETAESPRSGRRMPAEEKHSNGGAIWVWSEWI